MTQKQVILTVGSSWVVPSDCQSADSVELIGGGGGGSWARVGGGGGAYAKKLNVTLTPGASVSYQLGVGGAGSASSSPGTGTDGTDTWFVSSTTALAKGGQGGGTLNSGGIGGAAANCVGDTKYSGGNGATGGASRGAGGAAGLNGNGNNGNSLTGGTGDAGHGGTAGVAGTEWGTAGSGGGGSGSTSSSPGQDGGQYGAGGGAGSGFGGSHGGRGGDGVIVITYTPIITDPTAIAQTASSSILVAALATSMLIAAVSVGHFASIHAGLTQQVNAALTPVSRAARLSQALAQTRSSTIVARSRRGASAGAATAKRSAVSTISARRSSSAATIHATALNLSATSYGGRTAFKYAFNPPIHATFISTLPLTSFHVTATPSQRVVAVSQLPLPLSRAALVNLSALTAATRSHAGMATGTSSSQVAARLAGGGTGPRWVGGAALRGVGVLRTLGAATHWEGEVAALPVSASLRTTTRAGRQSLLPYPENFARGAAIGSLGAQRFTSVELPGLPFNSCYIARAPLRPFYVTAQLRPFYAAAALRPFYASASLRAFYAPAPLRPFYVQRCCDVTDIPTMNDFDPSEGAVLTFDASPDLAAGETLTTIKSTTVLVVSGSGQPTDLELTGQVINAGTLNINTENGPVTVQPFCAAQVNATGGTDQTTYLIAILVGTTNPNKTLSLKAYLPVTIQ